MLRKCCFSILLSLVLAQPTYAALTISQLVTGGSDSCNGPEQTESIAPSANAMLFVFVLTESANPNPPGAVTVTGNGVDYRVLGSNRAENSLKGLERSVTG